MMRTGWSALKKNITIAKTPQGYEQTSNFEGETLFWRHTNTSWLAAEFARHSCSLVRRDSGMFSDLYIYAPENSSKTVSILGTVYGHAALICPKWLSTTSSFFEKSLLIDRKGAGLFWLFAACRENGVDLGGRK